MLTPTSPFRVRRPSRARWLIGGVALVVIFFIVRTFADDDTFRLEKSNLLKVQWPTSLEFAGEPVPLDNFYVREAFEREFLITLASDYQNILYLKRVPKYFPTIEAELQKRDLPPDLKFVAVAESALREAARSSAGAEGIWQFIPTTARAYNLRVDAEIDERLNFEKATLAALDYFEFLHAKFGSWTLAAAAYNAGENGIARRLNEQDVASYYDLYLNSETARYLFRILAIKEILQQPEKYGYELSQSEYFEWPQLEVVEVREPISDLTAWSRQHSTTLRALKELNPWIVGESLPAGDWQIKIPE